MGERFLAVWSRANRHVLETFVRHHHAQGISSRVVDVEELFHPGTLEAHKI
jgi:4,5-dihydroxyphthalate decarboxylase